ncbi:MAG: SpoIIE family protein phosphatase [Planctomycetes bacterium]|nr:SpoIIE family protein phosphatase [Planctomycetota bacterium]
MTRPDCDRLADLQDVLKISRSMVAAANLDDLLELIVREAVRLLSAERATLFLHDSKTHELYTRTIAGGQAFRVPDDMGICGQTIKTGRTINVPDAYADSRFNPDVDRKTGFRTRNILSVPLRDFQGGLVGVLQVINKRQGPFDEYDVALGEVLAAQAGVAIQRAWLIEQYVEKQKMERAMQIAREIQQNLFPQESPRVCGFDVAGFASPADETGGDSYDFMPLPDGRWMFIVADASGHGIGPAIVIAETRAMLRAVSLASPGGCDISVILRTVNSLLQADMRSSRFVTCFYGLLDPLSATLKYASAGHGPLIFYDSADKSIHQVAPKSVPLGILDDTEYGEIDLRDFAPGDFLAIITDGFIEAVDGRDEQFGVERIQDMLRKCSGMESRQIVARLYDEVSRFAGGRPQADDLTALVIRRK